jgi:hypothetical protein
VNTAVDLAILQVKCVGGSTVVNGAVCFRVPNRVLENWSEEHDLDDRDFESMRKALRGTAQIYFAAGARRVLLPTTRRTTIEAGATISITCMCRTQACSPRRSW